MKLHHCSLGRAYFSSPTPPCFHTFVFVSVVLRFKNSYGVSSLHFCAIRLCKGSGVFDGEALHRRKHDLEAYPYPHMVNGKTND